LINERIIIINKAVKTQKHDDRKGLKKGFSPESYYNNFGIERNSDCRFAESGGKSKNKKALDRVWKNRDFEIEMYWTRATSN